jgi:hypothetical protein
VSLLPLRSLSLISFRRGHVNGIFDPVCNKVVDLVRTQVLAIGEETSTEAKVRLQRIVSAI